MELREYQEKASRTLARLGKLYPDDNAHMIFGIMTELGELSDAFKKNMAYGKPLDITNVQEEIGDIMWYIANFCNLHDFVLSDILDTNIAKLEVRYPEKFTEERAINRNLRSEREILEEMGIRHEAG